MPTPIEIHFCVVALLRHLPNRQHRDNVLFRGVAWHDGEKVELRTEDDDPRVVVLTDEQIESAMPVAGRIAKFLPGTDYYIVCGEELPMNGQRRRFC